MASLSEQGQNLKENLWAVIDEKITPLTVELKDTMNDLLDLIDELEEGE